MQLHDTIKAYGLISRLNHWLGALLVIVLLGLGLYFHEMPKGEGLTYWRGIHWLRHSGLVVLAIPHRLARPQPPHPARPASAQPAKGQPHHALSVIAEPTGDADHRTFDYLERGSPD